MPKLDTLRLIGSGGANRAMEAEVKRLAPRALGRRAPAPRRVDTQTLVYPFDLELAAFAVHWLRTPTRVVWDLFEIESTRLEPLFDELRAWIAAEKPAWLTQGTRISVRVPGTCDFPASGLQIRGTIKNAIIEGARAHGLDVVLDPDTPDVELTVRGKEKPLVLGIDLAGTSMHERGWRREEGEAPLKENLAAQILILSRWNSREEVLLDPMAGAGTLPIEGVLLARGAPVWIPPKGPVLDRLPAFRNNAKSDAGSDATKPRGDLFPDAAPRVVANEIHTPLVRALERNADRARARASLLVTHGDLHELDLDRLVRETKKHPPIGWPKNPDFSRGLLVANPPYGDRLEEGRGVSRELTELYESLADLHVRLGPGWRAAYISANPELERVYGTTPAMKKPMWNGPIRAWFLVYDRPPHGA